MNRQMFSTVVAAVLCCAGIQAQNPEPDCGALLPRAQDVHQATDDFRAWLGSVNRSEGSGKPAAVGLGMISARSLAHKPSPKARQEFDRGMQARRNGRASEALEHFATAARLDPAFADAQAYAGLSYSEARQASQALPYYEAAVSLEPRNAGLLSNLAAVLMAVDRPADAEAAARRAVQLAPSSPESHFMLGLALFIQKPAAPEAVAHLTIAAEKYPRAREILGRMQ